MKTLLFALALLLLLAAIGCERESTAPVAPQQDGIVAVEFPFEIPDPPAEPELLFDGWPDYAYSVWDVYRVRVLWGQLANDAVPAAVVTDWSGLMGVNGVAIVRVLHPIDFERDDSILVLDANHFAAWISKTSGDFDGIEVLVLNRNDIVYITPPVLSFETQPLQVSFHFSQLEELDTVITVDNLNSVAFHARKIRPPRCPRGELFGLWEFKLPGHGTFEGVWMGTHNFSGGRLGGKFWTTEDGESKFAGSWCDPLGNRRGELWGVWVPDDDITPCLSCPPQHGHFKGEFADLSGHVLGGLFGEFGPAMIATDHRLRFKGKWSWHCPGDGLSR